MHWDLIMSKIVRIEIIILMYSGAILSRVRFITWTECKLLWKSEQFKGCSFDLGTEHNFQKAEGSSTFNVPYDIKSIMHYWGTAFSKNRQPTMVSKVEIICKRTIGNITLGYACIVALKSCVLICRMARRSVTTKWYQHLTQWN
jgi:hypothetical protein